MENENGSPGKDTLVTIFRLPSS